MFPGDSVQRDAGQAVCNVPTLNQSFVVQYAMAAKLAYRYTVLYVESVMAVNDTVEFEFEFGFSVVMAVWTAPVQQKHSLNSHQVAVLTFMAAADVAAAAAAVCSRSALCSTIERHGGRMCVFSSSGRNACKVSPV